MKAGKLIALYVTAFLAVAYDARLTGVAFVVRMRPGTITTIAGNEGREFHLVSSRLLFERSSIICSSMVADDISNEDTASNTKDENGDFSFFDEATVYARAGSGGQGSSTYKRAPFGANGIPDGGSGGTGGNVVLRMDPGLNTLAGLGLRALRPNAFGGGGAAASSKRNRHSAAPDRVLSFRATDGGDGGRMYDNGRTGEDCEVWVPPGTVVRMEIPDRDGSDSNATAARSMDLGTISEETPALVIARGGKGGEGSGILKGKKKGAIRRSPEGGERGRIYLTLKIVADIALVGVPNAGKSTFLAAVTRAKPRIADYPFTTVVPNLGTWIPDDRGHESPTTSAPNALVLCDVPGLIEGASEGLGLGHAFLRHIERCRVILHLVDATSDDPLRDYAMVNAELKRYGTGSLAQKPQVVVLNKMDALENDNDHEQSDLAAKMKEEMGHTRLLWVSAKEKNGVDDLMLRMSSYVGKMKQDEEQNQREPKEDATPVA